MLSIMIVSHGVSSYVKQCCNIIVENMVSDDIELLLFLRSKDEKIAAWAKEQGVTCVIGTEMNLGAAYALLGGKAKGDTYIFLHDDVVLLHQAIMAMKEALLHGYAAVGPYTNRCQYQKQKVITPEYNSIQGIFSMSESIRREKKAQEVLFLESFCFMITREAYKAVGGFSDKFYAVGGEDIDMSFRLRAAGYHLQLVPAYVHHEGGTIACQHGRKDRPAWQNKVAQLIQEHWGLHTGVPEELWRESLQAFDWQRGGKKLIKASIRSCMLSAPLVSIMIPTYNRPVIFEKTLQSALAQTYPHIEIIVCDNSTNEDTKNLMQKYIDDERVRYIWNPEAKSKEENFAPFEKLAQGEYFQWCMDDDILLPDKLKKMLGVFAKHDSVKLVSSCRGIIDVTDKFYGKALGPDIQGEYGIFDGREIGKIMLVTTANIIGEPSATLFRRRDLQDHYWRASCREYLPIADVAMWLQLLENGDFAIFSEPLSYYRRHSEQEGQQPDIVLLARREWGNLAEEYYHRHIFLESQEDYQLALQRNIAVSKDFYSDIISQASDEERETFLSWLKSVEKRAAAWAR